MSLNVPLPRNTFLRLPKIKQGLKEGLNYEQIGDNCGVTEKTIDRDIKTWVQSGLFEIWLKTEFVELHQYMRVANPSKVYDNLSRIIGKMVTQRAEVKTEHTETQRVLHLHLWKPEQNADS